MMDNLFAQADLHFSVFRFTIAALDHLYLPEYKGSTFRGGLGTALALLCQKQSEKCRCDTCLDSASCPYALLFSNPSTSAKTPPLQAQNLPHPFVLRPPLTTRTAFLPGEEIDFELILFGNFVSFLPFYIFAFDIFGELGIGKGRSRFSVRRISDGFTGKLIYSQESQITAKNFTVMSSGRIHEMVPAWKNERMVFDFLTTTRILDNNKMVMNVDFSLLVRSLLRRASNLAALYEGQVWPLEYHMIIEQAGQLVPKFAASLHPASWERYSSSQQTRMTMEGFRGRIIYTGDFQPFLPLLFLGHYTHIGSKTTFGMGQYVVKED